MEKRKLPASDVLRKMVDKNQADRISFADIKSALHERGFAILMLALALPVALPIPMPPGLTIIPGIPLLILSMQMLVGLDSPWLPGIIGKRTIKRKTLAGIVEKAAPYLRKIERLLKPRLSLASSKYGERLIGLFAAIFSITMMVPVPLTQTVPALGVLVMSLGLLSKDGITIILGMVTGSIGVCFSMVVIISGEQAIVEITNWIKAFIS